MKRDRVRLTDDELALTKPQRLLPRNIIGSVVKVAKQDYWKVAGWYELDDLIQDGIMLAYKCHQRYGYPGEDIDAAHFRSLVKTSFSRHTTDLVRRKLGVPEVKFADMSKNGATEQRMFEILAGSEEGDQDLAMLIADLPDHLRKAVSYCLSEEGFKAMQRVFRERLDGTETFSERLTRLIGWPADIDFEVELRSHLWMDDRGFA